MGRIKYATEQEHNEVLEIMSKNLNKQDNPRVGIFWYDIREDELFGVVSAYPEEIRNISNGMKTIERLHRDHWKKEFHKQKFKGKPGPFVGDYKDTPRGRVWYDPKNDKFVVTIGSWIKKWPHVKFLIIEEFDLVDNNVEFRIDHPWEIGSEWEW